MAKKSFKQAIDANTSPAMAFLSNGEQTQPPETQEEIKPVERGNWKHRIQHEAGAETYSKRVQLLMRPSTKEALKEIADKQGKSLNNLINDIVEDALENMQVKEG